VYRIVGNGFNLEILDHSFANSVQTTKSRRDSQVNFMGRQYSILLHQATYALKLLVPMDL
jgi:hypothetical protein